MRDRSVAGVARLLRALVSVAVLLAGPACAQKTGPHTAPPPPATGPATAAPTATPAPAPAQPAAAASAVRPASAALAQELGSLFDAPAFDRMQWAVLVQSLSSGETLYSRNPSKLMMPASNMKIVTLAAAAERLGWDFTYETQLVSPAAVTDGVLEGDLVVVGSGDPTIGSRGGGGATRVFEQWADRLLAGGISAINGRVVADARAFDREPLGAGWAWDYLAAGYAAGVSALQFSESVADVVVRPAAAVGAPALVEVRPIESGLILDKRVTTAADGQPDLELSRLPGSNRLLVSGTIPLASAEVVRTATVDRPALYFARMLRATLVAKGIRVRGEAGEFEDVYPVPPTAPVRVLLSHRSAPLSEFARVLMKVSQNQYAETLLRTLGAGHGGTAAEGQKVVREVLDGWGVAPDSYILADGSGLSRYNYLSSEMLVKILRQLYRDPRHRDPFVSTLPIGGQDGTIARRFVGTRAAGNVRAKTGSIANTRALSGYVTTADGDTLVFSVLANSFSQPSSVIDGATDLAIERLANFTRAPAAPSPASR
jgi:serine-type D-Ala-D-Ala carboxypeptidase/endopeptidase (penicillin-binding protein 4)